jgi:hypothetical protein
MNFAERLAGLYLRLNGFFLMPEFSTFSTGLKTEGHAHVDILAFRPKGAFEEYEGVVFPVDASLFENLHHFFRDPFHSNIAIVCEVRTNKRGKFPDPKRREYAAQLCGTATVAMRCDRSVDNVQYDVRAKGIRLGLTHSLRWIAARIRWLNESGVHKSASWNLSEPELADFLVLNQLLPIQCENELKMMVSPRAGFDPRWEMPTE